jgi:Kef-type K+ transport system membrane component KefB
MPVSPNFDGYSGGAELFYGMQKTAQKILWLIFALMVVGDSAFASSGPEHGDPIAKPLLAIIAILVTAKLFGELTERCGSPSVLGELVGGILLGNLVLINSGWTFFEPLRVTTVQGYWPITVDCLSRLGVIILLFEVGLESTIKGMLKVGGSSFLVAVLGVIAPLILGFGASSYFIREIPPSLAAIVSPSFNVFYIHLFIGSVLCATSVGITARVFKDLKRLQTKEAQIILGAAVIDDVLGLIVLAVVSGMVSAAESGQQVAFGSITRLVLISVLFLVGTLIAGAFLVPHIMKQLSRLRTSGIVLVSSLVFAFVLAYLANLAGLAPIVGAFAAGLLLEEVHFRGFRGDVPIHQLIRPVSAFLVPIFFVLMGIQVRLESFANPSILGLAAGLTVAAIIGKQICGLGVLEKNLDRLSIGLGMIPRGEVGLIFASIGRSFKVIDNESFSAIVIMVIVTTLITPPLLAFTLKRKKVPE